VTESARNRRRVREGDERTHFVEEVHREILMDREVPSLTRADSRSLHATPTIESAQSQFGRERDRARVGEVRMIVEEIRQLPSCDFGSIGNG
jgi:hypothetical protein